MKVYKNTPESWTRYRNRMLIVLVVIVALGAAFVEWQLGLSLPKTPKGWALVMAMLAGMFLKIELERSSWQSHEIVLDGDRLIRRDARRRDTEIHRSDVVKVQGNPGHFLMVRASINRFIIVRSTLEGYEELASELRTWAPAGVEPDRPLTKALTLLVAAIAFAIINLGLYYCASAHL